MSDRCRWARDTEIGKFFLPGCMGGAVYGPGGCTCADLQQDKRLRDECPTLEDRMEQLEALVAQLVRERSAPAMPLKRDEPA